MQKQQFIDALKSLGFKLWDDAPQTTRSFALVWHPPGQSLRTLPAVANEIYVNLPRHGDTLPHALAFICTINRGERGHSMPCDYREALTHVISELLIQFGVDATVGQVNAACA